MSNDNYATTGPSYSGLGRRLPFDPYGSLAGPRIGAELLQPVSMHPPGMPAASTPAGGSVVYAHYAPATTAGGPVAPAPAASKPVEPATAKPEPKTVTVKSGDSLSKIAAANGTTWQKIYELNKDVIGGNPNLIRPGQVLKMP